MRDVILSVGFHLFPLGLAQVQRQTLMAKAMMIEGLEVVVLCRYGIHRKEDMLEPEGIFEGIKYIYCSGETVRPQNYVKRNFLKFKGLWNEFRYYLQLSKEKKIKGALVSTNNFYNILFYFLLGKIFGVSTVVDNVEHWTSKKHYKGFDRIDKWFYDRFYYIFADRIICISDFLISKVGKSRRSKVVKIPSITDFDKFKIGSSKKPFSLKYFLFCGSITYFEVIDFIITSFEAITAKNCILVLITQINNKLKERISKSPSANSIRIMTDISYEELVGLYMNSEGLLIPMRDSDEDRARFPHKISEYCAARRPIITNLVGEIGAYFNETNAYICKGYNTTFFASAMDSVFFNPEEANIKAENSYNTGNLYFNYKGYSNSLVALF